MSPDNFQVDLSNCDREPIHILGAVQPFAFLLALTGDWHIARASANVERFIGIAPQALLGRPLAGLVSASALHDIRNRLMQVMGAEGAERLFKVALFDGDARLFDVALHYANSQLVIEAELAQQEQTGSASTIRNMMLRLDQTPKLDAFFREGARQVRAMTGFDRVMVYRFDATGSGEVVAESAVSGIGSFMGLRYPASDIPTQARTLYLRNLFRVIADIGAAPVPIVPALDEAGAPLDLSMAGSRAVSPIHIEYLKNMGVGASLSISIVVGGKLWGLFACHHYSPRLPSLERRSLVELFGQMFAMKLENRERVAERDYVHRARNVADALLAVLANNAALLDDPGWLGQTLNDAIEADGVGVSINSRIALSGLTPNAAQFGQLIRSLNATASNKIYATDCIVDLEPTATAYRDLAAGMLAMPISRSPRDYVVMFRQEIVRTVRWAGDPHKPVEYGPNGPRLTPRKSFETWSELVKGHAKPFTAMEQRVAEMLRTTLIEVVLRLSGDAHTERQLATDRQELLIAELNHRVRNILNLIRSMVRQSQGSASSVDDFVWQVDLRINALARAHNQITADRWGAAPLRALIETEAQAYFAGNAKQVEIEGADVLLQPQAFSTMALVLHELITNSAKYGSLSDSGRVRVQWHSLQGGDLEVRWQESGGPAVKAPTRQGFGSTLIQRSIPYELGGEAAVDYRPEGLEARFRIPARHVTQRATSEEPISAKAPVATAHGERPAIPHGAVLVVEDSLIISMEAEELLRGMGAARVHSAATAEQGLQLIERETPVLAMLDLNLGDETSVPVALRLSALGVPFLFATGYGERATLPPELADSPILQKPYTGEALAEAIAMLLSARQLPSS